MLAEPIHYSTKSAMLIRITEPIAISPKNHGMNYRDIKFSTCDDLVLRGWLINEGANKVIIMTHFGCRNNRFGYQPKDPPLISEPYKEEIEFYSVAKHLVKSGYSVLMYDSRNQGASDKSELEVYTDGFEERFDLIAAVDFAANKPSLKGKPIGLLSYSNGANISFLAMHEYSDIFTQSGVKAMVAVQPLSNGDYFEASNLPESIYRPAKQDSQVASSDYALIASVEEAAKSTCIPTRLLQVDIDPFANLNRIAGIFKNIPVKKEMFWLAESNHRFDGYNWFAEHPRDMLDWFDLYLK